MADPSRNPCILVVDDERAVRSALRVNLTKAGYEVILASDGQAALQTLSERVPDLVLTDLRMPHVDGMLLLESVQAEHPDLPVVLMTGHGSVRDAVHAMRSGASDYIIKPVRKDELLVILERTLKACRLEAEVVRLREALDSQRNFEQLVGGSTAMQRLYALIGAVADSDALVLVNGPTGAGKELVSRAIHARSNRVGGPFVALNCAALPEQLLESELFGHEKGSFTGAVRRHAGRFEQASGGTLLLDEIGEIPVATQVRLLRVLESGIVQRVGGTTPVKVNTRVIAATNRNLAAEVEAGRFRADLYYRLNVFRIPVPSLADRIDDIPLLTDHFVQVFARRHDRPARVVSSSILHRLQQHSWPGNVRELSHVVERAVLLTTGATINEIDLEDRAATQLPSPDHPKGGRNDRDATGADAPLPDRLRILEEQIIIEALRTSRGIQAEAARRLGISRSNLHYRIRKLGIELTDVQYIARGTD